MNNTTPSLGSGDSGSILGWSLVLVVLLVLMFGAIGFLKKWLAGDEKPESRVGFTLGDLREMHRTGQLTDEEYEKARTQMIAATQRAAERAAQQAREAALNSGASRGSVTDIEELRKRARQHRDGPNPPPSTDEPPPAAESRP